MPIRIEEDEWEDSYNDKNNDWDSEDNWDNTEVDSSTDWDKSETDTEDTKVEPEPTWDNNKNDWEDSETDWNNNTNIDWDNSKDENIRDFDESEIMDTYAVSQGDTLWNIAEEYYGDGSKYELIYMANADVMQNPNIIFPGMVLKIPYDE